MRLAVAIIVLAIFLMGCVREESAPTAEPPRKSQDSVESTPQPDPTSDVRSSAVGVADSTSTPSPTATPPPAAPSQAVIPSSATSSPTATTPSDTSSEPAYPWELSALREVRESTVWRETRGVFSLEAEYPFLTTALLSLPWVQDGITEEESGDVQELVWAGLHSVDVLKLALQSPWVVDGMNDDERDVVTYLWNVGFADEAAGRWLMDQPFIQDMTAESAAGAASLARLVLSGRPFAEKVLETWWIADGLDYRETQVTQSLFYIVDKGQDTALRILEMPFLDSIETSDVLAMQSMSLTLELVQMLSHPSLSGGITDEMAKRIAVLYAHLDAKDILLDPTIDLVAERQLSLPLTGDVTIALISRASGSEQILDIMESAVRHHESFMGLPFPIDYIILVHEGPEFGSGGYFKGPHAFIQSGLRINDYAISHELAHFYWSHGSFWIDEGAADLLAFSNIQIEHLNELCPDARSIADMEPAMSDATEPVHCSYSLGMRLFADLERNLGEDIFRQGFRNLYIDLKKEGYWGVERAAAAFEAVKNAPEGSVNRLFERWYHGTQPYDEAEWDPRPVNGSVPSINGRISEAYVSATAGGPPSSSVSGRGQMVVTAWLTLGIDYDVAQDVTADIEIVQYYEDGFAYGSNQTKVTVDASRTSMEVEIPLTIYTKSGQHGIYVYSGGQKVGQVEFDIIR